MHDRPGLDELARAFCREARQEAVAGNGGELIRTCTSAAPASFSASRTNSPRPWISGQ